VEILNRDDSRMTSLLLKDFHLRGSHRCIRLVAGFRIKSPQLVVNASIPIAGKSKF
jgi:hypothetical protein